MRQPVPSVEPAGPPAEVPAPRVAIRLEAPARLAAEWEGPRGHVRVTGDLRGDAAERERTLELLRAGLADLSDRWREPDGTSRVTVVVMGPRVARWDSVQRVMETLAHPSVRIYRMQFAVRSGGE